MKKVMLIGLTLAVFVVCGFGCARTNLHDREILEKMDNVAVTWNWDFSRIGKSIEELNKKIDSSFFESEENRRAYINFLGKLKLASVPEEKRIYVGVNRLLELFDLFSKNCKIMMHCEDWKCAESLILLRVCYAGLLRDEYKNTFLLERELETFLLNMPQFKSTNDIICVDIGTQEDFRKYIETERRKKKIEGNKKYWASRLALCEERCFDDEDVKFKLSKIPEPRRTELINYIEDKLGRKMKWRQ